MFQTLSFAISLIQQFRINDKQMQEKMVRDKCEHKRFTLKVNERERGWGAEKRRMSK